MKLAMQGVSSSLLEVVNREELCILGTNLFFLLLLLMVNYPSGSDIVPSLYREEA